MAIATAGGNVFIGLCGRSRGDIITLCKNTSLTQTVTQFHIWSDGELVILIFGAHHETVAVSVWIEHVRGASRFWRFVALYSSPIFETLSVVMATTLTLLFLVMASRLPFQSCQLIFLCGPGLICDRISHATSVFLGFKSSPHLELSHS